MGFKTVTDFNKDRYKNLFILQNDGDYADVIFLYTRVEDVLIPEFGVHYIKSADYSGYVHCLGKGCPACAKGIRTQPKLFIPLYNIQTGEIEFFDRSLKFEPQLKSDVFANFPNPSEYVFRITRRGAANDMNTRYEITVVARNETFTRDQILANAGLSYEGSYELIVKSMNEADMKVALNPAGGAVNESYQFTPVPRGSVETSYNIPETVAPDAPAIPDVAVPELVTPPEEMDVSAVNVDASSEEIDHVEF